MPRKIKEVIIGLPDSPVIKQDWDITPLVSVETAELSIVQLENAITVDDRIVADVTGNTDTDIISVVKTNINMSGLGYNKTIKLCFEVTDAPLLSIYALGMYIAPGNLSAAAVEAEIRSIFFGGAPFPNNRLFHYALSFNTSYQAVTAFRIPNLATPSGVTGEFGNVNSGILDLVPGTTSGLLLSRRNNNLYIGRFDAHSDGVQYDLNGREAVVNGPVFNDDMTLYYFTLCADQGSGLENVAYIPSLTLSPPSYDIAGTSAETNNVDWTNFSNPERPSTSVTSQATLPEDARIGQFYKVVIDPLYTGPDPTPYGYTLKNNQTILINSITGENANITAYVDNQSLIELVGDIVEPVVEQQTIMLQTVADLGDLVQQTQQEVNVALLNTESLTVYVKDPTIGPGVDSLLFSTSVSFDTFHEAYLYLITLPKFIKKTIVLDDRGTGNVTGDLNTTYQLFENNITLSTYVRYVGDVEGIVPINTGVTLTIDCTGLRLNRFEGIYNHFNLPIQSDPIAGISTPVLNDIRAKVCLGNDSSLTMSDNGIILNGQNLFTLGERSHLTLHLFRDVIAALYTPLHFHRGRDSSVTVTGNLLVQHPTYEHFVILQKPHDNTADSIGFVESNILVDYTDVDPLYDPGSGNRIVRSLKDLGEPDSFNSYTLLASGGENGYHFVKSLNLAEKNIKIPTGQFIRISAAPGVIISNDGIKPVLEIDQLARCVDEGVHFSMGIMGGAGIPVFQNKGEYYRTGGRVDGNKLFVTTSPVVNNSTVFHMFNVDHYPNPSYSGITEPSLAINCSDLFIQGMRVKGVSNNTSVLEIDIDTLDPSHSYRLDQISLSRLPNASNGVVNIVGNYYKNNPNISENISIKNVTMRDATGIEKHGPLVSKDGSLHGHWADPAFDYDGKKLALLIYKATGSAAGGPVMLGGAATSSLVGWVRDSAVPEYFRFLSRKPNVTFRYRLKANVYRNAAGGNASIGIKFLNLVTNQVSGDETVFVLPSTGVRVPIDIVIIGGSPQLGHIVFVYAVQVPNNGQQVFFENAEFTIEEL